ncbi:cytochrome P450 [Cristinia sonorae]|uniref:Cytochrome P450 n=1 Tax=Cristinia sonorae TaxID=1940300 RepID=A0A8K0UTS1_9AGAR|nr:cytochrome P450 [Cristinia sonorae]
MSLQSYTVQALIGGLVLTAVCTVVTQGRRWKQLRAANPLDLPLPPGPKALPIIGNLLEIPQDKPWLYYDGLLKKYGDVVYLNIFGLSMVILGSAQAVSDLMEKRSSNYSDRFHPTMLNDVMKFDWMFVLMPYGERWRRHRKTFKKYFGKRAADQYRIVHDEQSRALLRRLKDSPEQFFSHIRQATGATIMKITYGFSVKDGNDKWIDLAELRHVPAWVPGAGFQKVGAYYRQLATAMLVEPFEMVKETLRTGLAGPSASAFMLEKISTDPASDLSIEEQETIARNCTAIAYAAGADTTTSALQTFFLAMVLYPEVQRKAQATLDTVVGPTRLPTFDDREALPYIEAIVKETLRWQLVAPLAAAHLATDNDQYRGYHIPKGTLVIGVSLMSILHNPDEFPEPETFKPERFLKDGHIDPDVRDPATAAFGFGRRICPGTAMASNTLYSAISCVLHTFSISYALDENGLPVLIKPDMSTGIVSNPAPFSCTIKPRSAAAELLVANE